MPCRLTPERDRAEHCRACIARQVPRPGREDGRRGIRSARSARRHALPALSSNGNCRPGHLSNAHSPATAPPHHVDPSSRASSRPSLPPQAGSTRMLPAHEYGRASIPAADAATPDYARGPASRSVYQPVSANMADVSQLAHATEPAKRTTAGTRFACRRRPAASRLPQLPRRSSATFGDAAVGPGLDAVERVVERAPPNYQCNLCFPLLIRGFRVRAPGAPPVLTWPFAAPEQRAGLLVWAEVGQGMGTILMCAVRTLGAISPAWPAGRAR